MYILKTIGFALMLFCYNGTDAQNKCIKDAFGRLIAFESAQGNIVNVTVQVEPVSYDTLGHADTITVEELEAINTGSTVIVRMQDAVTIIDGGGNLMAVYNPETKELRDMTGDLIFTLDETNQVVNVGGLVIGKIESGIVYDINQDKIAEGPGIDFFKLAYFCFYSNK